ncbi:MAG: hypothetical protein PHF97_09865 [Bacteroidales bacterium]|nr:hypothetical protein [Bacteroidales bacterium]
MGHFTYSTSINKDCLKQGDLLEKTQELSTILEKVHPFFIDKKYDYFIVLTQSCDLYKKGDRTPKAKYITIAPVRPFEDALFRESQKLSSQYLEIKTNQIFDEQKKAALADFIVKLLNNNTTDYFYLHNDYQLPEPHVAFLRVSIALRIEHYDVCLKSKFLELTDNFQSKLGWIVGNLYSRVGTEDWETYCEANPDVDFDEMVKTHLERNFWFVKNISKVENKLLETISKDKIEELDTAQIREIVSQIKIQTRKEKFDERLDELIKSKSDIITEGKTRKALSDLIKSDSIMAELLK